MTTTITRPGLYDGIPDADYHADPIPGGSLSSTGARLLLPPSCPARFQHWRQHGGRPRAAFDIGHAAHRLVLGVGPELVVVDAPDWRTRAARDARDAAHAAGQVPLLAAEYDVVQAMAAALREHPLAGPLLDPSTGRPEVTAAWIDTNTGTWLRARYDWLRDQTHGRPIIVDYKTTDSADPSGIRRSIYRYGYYQQDPWYLDGLAALGVDDAAFLFVFQEKTPPYLVTVVELDDYDRAAGRDRNRRAIDIYAHCTATGEWPGYATDVIPISLPTWAHHEEQ